jgi:hypothetical protein
LADPGVPQLELQSISLFARQTGNLEFRSLALTRLPMRNVWMTPFERIAVAVPRVAF